MIQFPCEHCGAELQVSDDKAGKPGKCLKCGKIMRVPPMAEVVSQPAAASVKRTRALSRKPRDARSGKMVRYRCPHCRRDLVSPASLVGKEDTCGGCGQTVVPKAPIITEATVGFAALLLGLVLAVVLPYLLVSTVPVVILEPGERVRFPTAQGREGSVMAYDEQALCCVFVSGKGPAPSGQVRMLWSNGKRTEPREQLTTTVHSGGKTESVRVLLVFKVPDDCTPEKFEWGAKSYRCRSVTPGELRESMKPL